MKRKFTLILTIIVVAGIFLTGCDTSKIPFLNKGVSGTEDVPISQESRAYVSGTGIYNMGDMIVFEDIVTIDEEYAGDVIGSVIMKDGQECSNLPTDTAGENSAIIAVEFLDGFTWSAEFAYIVEGTEESYDAIFSDSINESLKSDDWAIIDVGSYSNMRNGKVSYSIDKNLDVQVGDGMSVSYPAEKHWEFILLTSSEEEMLASNGVSPLRTSISSIVFKSLLNMSVSFDEGSYTDQDKQRMEWISQAIDDLVTVSTMQTEMVVYKDDGSTLPVKVANVYYPQECGVDYIVQCYYVDYDVDCRLVMYYISESGPFTVDSIINSDEEIDFESYDECKQFVKDYIVEYVQNTHNPSSDALNSMICLTDSMVLGDVSEYISVAAPTQGASSGEVSVGEPNDEEGELLGAIANARLTYAQMYPDLYIWPFNENGDEYRKWTYTIDNGVSFIGSIWLGKEGRYFNSEEDMLASQGGSGSGGSGGVSTPVDHGNVSQSASIITRYGTYVFSNSKLPQVTINTDKSTNNIINLEYDGNKYYIESASASTIQNYKSACIYSMSQFGSEDYSVDEYRTTTTDIGVLTEYTIQYFDMAGAKKDVGYMVVYNINNDYLVIYADNFDNDTSMMRQMIMNMLL